jgi:hypothetical protein
VWLGKPEWPEDSRILFNCALLPYNNMFSVMNMVIGVFLGWFLGLGRSARVFEGGIRIEQGLLSVLKCAVIYSITEDYFLLSRPSVGRRVRLLCPGLPGSSSPPPNTPATPST